MVETESLKFDVIVEQRALELIEEVVGVQELQDFKDFKEYKKTHQKSCEQSKIFDPFKKILEKAESDILNLVEKLKDPEMFLKLNKLESQNNKLKKELLRIQESEKKELKNSDDMIFKKEIQGFEFIPAKYLKSR